MTLAPGTALQNGHYVVDALLEAAPNGDLYWGTHVVSGMQVFIQVFPVAASHPSDDLSALIARLEGIAFAPQSPLPNPFQLFHGDANTLCLAMGITVGQPWTVACGNHPPFAPKQALATLRQIAASVTWLEEQGITGLDLSPNRVWLTPEGDRLTLTGLPQAQLNLTAPAPTPAHKPTVWYLARLLYSFLLGELPPTDPAIDLKARLQERLPNLSPLLAQAIAQGATDADPAVAPPSLADWLAQLPDANPVPLTTTKGALVPRPPQPPPTPPSRPRFYSALGGTALVAAIAGISLGTAWRLSAKSLPGAIQFQPNQSFPTQSNWSGDQPEAAFETPFIPAQGSGSSRDEWYEPAIEPLPETPQWDDVPTDGTDWRPEPEPSYNNEATPDRAAFEDAEPVDEPTAAPSPEPAPAANESLPAPSVPQDFTVPPLEAPVPEN
ncbi:MAG TPA: hypothetical protein V6D02_07830 [Candidatus Obscuribacterales bacterium]